MSKPTNDNLLETTSLHKSYMLGHEPVHVLRGVEVHVTRGEWLCILGRSGSGKSTLLHLMGGLDTPDEGSVVFDHTDLYKMNTADRDQFRNSHVGFVFQFYHLLPELNVVENTLISAMIGHTMFGWYKHRSKMYERANEMLTRLGLGDRLKHRPNELSGGERQRVAIARALINQPQALLADEPTGNLDRTTGETILDLLSELHQGGQTIVMVSHDQRVADRADRVLELENGKLK